MSSTDSLGNTSTSARKRQRPNAIRTKCDTQVNVCGMLMRSQHIRVARRGSGLYSTADRSIRKEFECGYFNADTSFCRDELSHRRTDHTCTLEHDEGTRLGNLKVYNLACWRISRVYALSIKQTRSVLSSIPMTENVAPALRMAITATTRSTLR